jgi:hypothetical protein
MDASRFLAVFLPVETGIGLIVPIAGLEVSQPHLGRTVASPPRHYPR